MFIFKKRTEIRNDQQLNIKKSQNFKYDFVYLKNVFKMENK